MKVYSVGGGTNSVGVTIPKDMRNQGYSKGKDVYWSYNEKERRWYLILLPKRDGSDGN